MAGREVKKFMAASRGLRGWYAKVLAEGVVRLGDRFVCIGTVGARTEATDANVDGEVSLDDGLHAVGGIGRSALGLGRPSAPAVDEKGVGDTRYGKAPVRRWRVKDAQQER
mmetsp:Transcript_10203/g.25552  ORF Transcript_10203/g.25552 Transcript_10203/m.25552 type:complete len:111 (+) Transcript_10203:1-333(+)